MRGFAKYLILICLCALSTQVRATHIMGGDLNYEWIEEDSFKFTLVYYVDCVNGNLGAISSDVTAFFGFFDAKTKDLLSREQITRNDPIRVSRVNYECVKELPNACVDRYEYVFHKRIDPGSNGIIVSFQRCCRNHTITNLVDPGGTGMTITAFIPGDDDGFYNSNPVFKASPPNFLCNDALLDFDHSATDKDGDSLVYDLYIPFKGATRDIPRPTTPSKPDYEQVEYKSSYTIQNMMGGKQKLQIDRHTGRLTVWPDVLGQFVVGIRVSEYRDGKRIGESLRDYQFNVLECKIGVQAGFTFPDLRCSDTVVTFTNTSSASDQYLWSFDSLNSGVTSSNSPNPTKVFAKKGTYKIKLIAQDKDCSDSVTKTIQIGVQDSIQASFTVGPKVLCVGETIKVNNTSDPTPDWFWDLGRGQGEQHNLDLNEILYEKPGEYVVKLRILDSLNCMSEKVHTDTVIIFEMRELLSSFDVERPNICNPGNIILTKTDSLSDKWIWQIEGIDKEYENEEVIELNGLADGSHTIRLISTANSDLCTTIKAASEDVVIDSDQLVGETQLYNVFTPNNDGRNDCYWLDIEGYECTDVRLVIYNRWGEELFDSEKDNKSCWDGKRPNGSLYPPGTYFGLFTLENAEAKYSDTISVTISLIR